jgi:bacteriorhodopsin
MSKKQREGQDGGAPQTRPRWVDYFWANVIFFVFLFALVFVVRSSCESPGDAQTPAVGIVLDETFKFIVALFGGGFILVTVFDAAYEFFAEKAQDGPSEPPQA